MFLNVEKLQKSEYLVSNFCNSNLYGLEYGLPSLIWCLFFCKSKSVKLTTEFEYLVINHLQWISMPVFAIQLQQIGYGTSVSRDKCKSVRVQVACVTAVTYRQSVFGELRTTVLVWYFFNVKKFLSVMMSMSVVLLQSIP